MLEFWNEAQVFKKSVEREASNGDFVFYDGPLFNEHPHPGVNYDSVSLEFTYGLHLTRNRFGFRFMGTVQPDPIVNTSAGTRYDFGTLSVEYAF